jgi:type III secretion protein L
LEARERAAFEEGKQAGLREGEARATRQSDAQLAAVSAGLAQAQEAFERQLRDVEALAIEMTQAVLDRLFGDPALQQALVVQTIQHHLASLSADAVLRLHVSRDDFPDTETSSAAWLALTQHGQRDVRATPALPAGACTIDLTVGRLDLGLSQQLARAHAALQELRHA